MNITRELAYKCAVALVDKHNAIPQDEYHDNAILVSFRSLYNDLRALGMEFLIASAQRPQNKRNLPLFVNS